MRVVCRILGGGIEHREEAAHDQVVELLLRFVQMLRRLQRRNDREVVRDLAVVEDALVRLHPALLRICLANGAKLVRVAAAPPASP